MCFHHPLQQCGSLMCLNRFWKTMEEKYAYIYHNIFINRLFTFYFVFSCESLHLLMCLFCSRLMKFNWALTLFLCLCSLIARENRPVPGCSHVRRRQGGPGGLQRVHQDHHSCHHPCRRLCQKNAHVL